MSFTGLAPAAQAFDAVAPRFDERFGAWESVAAQRRAVRGELARVFAPGSSLIEIGGGTGEDAVWMAQQGYRVQLTDPSPAMVEIARAKLAPLGAPAPLCAEAEHLEVLGFPEGFDGAFSNFAALNCVSDLRNTACELARLIRPGGAAALVIFGTCSPGEWIVELCRQRPAAAFRRFQRGDVPARLGGREFTVRYHRASDVARAFAPWFALESRLAVGLFVPPSAAEPWITKHPRLLDFCERIDRHLARPLAPLGDHVMYVLRRNSTGPAA